MSETGIGTAAFRQRLRAREPLVGTFVKTTSYQTVEVLGASGLDFLVLDAEHAPFDRNQLDVCILAARAVGLPALVRTPDDAAETVLQVLDMGAAGVLVPHVVSPEDVRRVVAASRYRQGVRGFSNSPRAGGYGRVPMIQHIEVSDRDAAVVCQVEDRQAVEAIDAIAAVDEVDCLFIGRADLAVSYEVYDLAHAAVDAAVERVCKACRTAGKASGVFLGDTRDVPRYLDLGVTLFVISSDQSLLRSQAGALATTLRSLTSQPTS